VAGRFAGALLFDPPRRQLNLARWTRGRKFRHLHSVSVAWMDSHFELIERGAPWLHRVGGDVWDFCKGGVEPFFRFTPGAAARGVETGHPGFAAVVDRPGPRLRGDHGEAGQAPDPVDDRPAGEPDMGAVQDAGLPAGGRRDAAVGPAAAHTQHAGFMVQPRTRNRVAPEPQPDTGRDARLPATGGQRVACPGTA
jgi:hypothetical protein